MDINSTTTPIKSSQNLFKKYKKMFIYGVVAFLITAMLITGPILMQEFNGKNGSHHTNLVACWFGAIMIAMPIIFLSVMCFILIFKKKKNK